MAYDEQLADRFRGMLAHVEGVSEKRMMGGICFLHHGNMIGGADQTQEGVNRFMFRVGKENEAEAMTRTGAMIMEQGGRRMTGMIFVHEDHCDDHALHAWVELALSFVTTLPPK